MFRFVNRLFPRTFAHLLGKRRAAKWNMRYLDGRWDFLERVDELAHYSVIAGYALALKPGGDLLDVGCGIGLLRERLHPASFGQYLGIDFSEIALKRALSRQDHRTRFILADMHRFASDRSFDTIVLNEVLYSFLDPLDGLRRYERMLNKGGVFIVSTFMTEPGKHAWTRVGDAYPIIDETKIVNGAGTEWLVRVLDGQRS
jgi:2-polyprenyl-3-methyl-5-hydroxy-6-metoxy-1,4-benzoquinol methylase